MKKIATLVLVGILLFNWIGFQLTTSVMAVKANQQLEKQLDDNNYDESQLISIKIPIERLSYYQKSETFMRIDGHIKIKGILYNYVKYRLYNDCIELLCIPNYSLMKLQNAGNNVYKHATDLQLNNSKQKIK